MQMRTLKTSARVVAVISSLVMVSCDDAASDNDVDELADGSVDPSTPAQSKDDASVPDTQINTGKEDAAVTSLDASVGARDGSQPNVSDKAKLPELLSVTGCSAQFIPALCTIKQTGSDVVAKCGAVNYTGTFNDTTKALTLNAPETIIATGSQAGARVNVSCVGKLENDGTISATCTRKQSAATAADAGVAPADTTCQLKSDPQLLPGVACLELPATLNSTVLCKEGADAGGETISAGTCKISQDGCRFQADCADNVVFAGSVTANGISFTQRLKALADAVTPNSGTPPVDGTPAFKKGDSVNHTCAGTVIGGLLDVRCTAGAARRDGVAVAATSVCKVEGSGTAPATCNLIAPKTENVFALDSCSLLKDGDGQNPGIGEPVCAYRQNGCVWDLQCGNDPLLKFSGRLPGNATKLSWTLPTGTPCELDWDAQGNVTGSCTVAGQAPCALASKTAVPGGASCPALPVNTSARSRGCGGGDPLDCRVSLQHGCNYLGVCSFTGSYPSEIIAGTTSYKEGGALPYFEFSGVGGYQCWVQKASAAEIASTDPAVKREATEWYGNCGAAATPTVGACRNNWSLTNLGGYRALQVFFEAPQ